MIIHNEQFLKVFRETDGALSVCESVAILNLAKQAPPGIYMELGTFAGKSAMSAAQGLQRGTFYLVDPIFAFDEKEGVDENVHKIHDKEFCKNVIEQVANNGILPVLLGEYSITAIPKFNNYSWVFVDSGSHQDGLPMQEVKLLEDRMISGGIIAFHDYESQFSEVKIAHEYLISTGKYENVEIDWERIKYYVESNDLEKGNKSWHHTEIPLPCFVGAVKRK